MTTIHRLRASWRRGDRGAAAVEFALILPLLALLTFGIINFGWWFGQYLSLNHAVREGARRAVVDSSATASDITTFVTDATGSMVNDSSITFTPAPAPCAEVGSDLTVTAEYDPEWLVPDILGFDAPGITALSVFRCEVS